MYKEVIKGGAFVALLLTLIVLQAMGVIDLSAAAAWLEHYAEHWWAPALLVGVMVVLYTFALPASTLMLAAGVMFVPVWATLWSTLGGVLGAWAAYVFVQYGMGSKRWSHQQSTLYTFLQANAGFATLTALRILPGFPHSVLNYSASLLRVPLSTFLVSSTIGHVIKSFIYTSAMHQATHVDTEADAFTLATLWPLFALVALILAGLLVRRLIGLRNKDGGNLQ